MFEFSKNLKRSESLGANNIPSGWEMVNIEEVVEESYGIVDGPFGSNLKSVHYRKSGIPVIQSGFVTSGVFLADAYVYVDQALFQAQKRSAVRSGDIVMAKIGAQCGMCAMLPNGHPISILAGNALKISVKQSKCRVKYLLNVLHYYYEIGKIDIIKTETAQPAISLKNLRKLKFLLPPPSEQDVILSILDSISEEIYHTEQLIAKLEHQKAGLLHDLLTRGIDEHGQLRDPITHPEHFKDSVLGKLPKEWDVSSIGSLAVHVGSGLTPTGGSEVYKAEGIIFIRSQNVTFNGLLLNDVAYIDVQTHERMKRSEVFAYDVLLNITGASIGRCCLLPSDITPANVNQHVCAIRLPNSNREDSLFLSSVLASYLGQSQINRLNAGGNREGLNYQQLRSFLIPWPKKNERASITKIIDTLTAHIRSEEAYRNKLKLSKKGLMQNLLTRHI